MSDDEDPGVRVRTVLSAKELADDDTEVWLFRTPLDFDPKALAAAGAIKVDEGAAPGTVLRVLSGGKDGKGGFEVQVGEASGGQAFQVLAQDDEDEDEDDDDEDEEGSGPALRIPKPIARHFVVVRRPPTTPGREDDEEGEEEDGEGGGEATVQACPPPAVPLVVPYAPIAQVPDLQVRFKPAGAGTAPPPPLPGVSEKGKKKRRLSEEEEEAEAAEEEQARANKKKKKDKKR